MENLHRNFEQDELFGEYVFRDLSGELKVPIYKLDCDYYIVKNSILIKL